MGGLLDTLMTASLAFTVDQQRWLVGRGVATGIQARAGYIGSATVRPSGGLFDFGEDGDGEPALIQGVWPGPFFDATGEIVTLLEDVVDLVAWDPRDPARFWRHHGVGRWLGEWSVFAAASSAEGVPLRLHRTPLGWLRGGCAGAVLLESVPGLAAGEAEPEPRGPYLRELLDGACDVVCDDDDHGLAVHGALRRRRPAAALPKVHVAEAEAAA